MTSYISLLRGINVGGNRKVPMKELCPVYEGLGLEQVQSYIQSGNVVFVTDASIEEIQAKLYEAIAARFGFAVAVMHRSLAEWREILAANPFPVDNPKAIHAFLLEQVPSAANIEALMQVERQGEELAIIGRTLFFYTPNGFGTSKLANVMERKLKVSMTARNWNTMLKLLEMAEGLTA